jgi:hypothetical protein
MKRPSSRKPLELGGEHFGNFYKEVFPRELPSLFNTEAIRASSAQV